MNFSPVAENATVSSIFQTQIDFLLSCAALGAAFSVCVSKKTPASLIDTGVIFTNTCGNQE